MVAVFAGFAAGDLVMFQQMGFGLGVAILVDATIVRIVLMPATMELLGDRNWYLPHWLELAPRSAGREHDGRRGARRGGGTPYAVPLHRPRSLAAHKPVSTRPGE